MKINSDRKLLINSAISVAILCVVFFSSLFFAYSFLDIISIYWHDFGLYLTIWGIILFFSFFAFKKKGMGKYLLCIAIAVLLAGLAVLFFIPEQISPELR